MKRRLTILAAAAGAILAAPSAQAHHSHPYFYDQCASITIEGRVESVMWQNPHSIIIVKLDDGTAYTVDWDGLRGLTNNKVLDGAQASLVFGVRVAVTGNPIRTTAQIREHFPELPSEVNPKTIDPTRIRRADDSWSWSRKPEGQPAEKPPDCKGK